MPQPHPRHPGERYDFFVFDAYRLRDGMLAEHWTSIDWMRPRGTAEPWSAIHRKDFS
jgi:predicted SnoaL-like aldol condensation-catalyzing enzyme